MTEYTLQIETIDGIADSDYLDRLADIVYAFDDVYGAFLGLNDDGSISASFSVDGDDPRAAASRGLDVFVQALIAADPLRAAGVDSFAVRPVDELPEAVSA